MHNYRCAIWRVPVRCQGHTDTPSPYEPQARHARSDVGHRGAGEIPPDVLARTVAPAPQRSPRLPPHAPRPGCLRPPTASDDPSKHRFPLAAPTLRSPGGATMHSEKSTPSPLRVAAGHRRVAFPVVLATPRCLSSRPPGPNPLLAPGL